MLGCAALTGVGAVLFAGRCGGWLHGARRGSRRRRPVRRPGGAHRGCQSDRLRRSQRGAARARAPPRCDAGRCSRTVFARSCRTTFPTASTTRSTRSAIRRRRRPRSAGRGTAASCVIVGLPAAGARLELDPTEFIRREKRLTGTIYGSEDPAVALPVLLGHVRSGALDLSSQLGPQFSLDDANDAVEAALAGVPGRVLVTAVSQNGHVQVPDPGSVQ